MSGPWERDAGGVRAIGACALAALPAAAIVDIRPQPERYGELGYIPGSVSFSEARLTEAPDRLLEWCPLARPVVLTCLSGKRCEPWVTRLEVLGYQSVGYLEGGVLAWGACGLPTAGVRPVGAEQTPVLTNLFDFPRVVLACFVAQSVEFQLAAGSAEVQDPTPLVQELFEHATVAGGSPDGYLEALDRLADQARMMRYPLGDVAANLDVMRATLTMFVG